jgi:hypothetical protein
MRIFIAITLLQSALIGCTAAPVRPLALQSIMLSTFAEPATVEQENASTADANLLPKRKPSHAARAANVGR